ncbi:MAG TPA: G1 family glutamic endopeptidase [Streptosporangiaceae bacterium]|jgi:hypothetical protein
MAEPASAVVSGGGLYGYAVTGSTYTTVTGDWNIPTLTCTSGTSSSSIWVGLDGYSSPTVEQTGIDLSCVNGTAQGVGWYEMYPAAPVFFSNPVQPGDSVSAAVTYNGSSDFTLTLTDTTQGWQHTVHASLAGAARSSAEAVVEDPSDSVFSPIHFTGVTVNGAPLGSLSPVKLTGGDSRIVVSPVMGSSFSVSWHLP